MIALIMKTQPQSTLLFTSFNQLIVPSTKLLNSAKRTIFHFYAKIRSVKKKPITHSFFATCARQRLGSFAQNENGPKLKSLLAITTAAEFDWLILANPIQATHSETCQ